MTDEELKQWEELCKMSDEQIKKEFAEKEKQAKEQGFASLRQKLDFARAEEKWLQEDY